MTTPADGFHFDPAGVRQAINQLTHARDELQDIRREAESMRRNAPPGNDQVSWDAMRALIGAATGDKGSLTFAVGEAIDSINQQIESMQAALTSYGSSDSGNAAGLANP